MRGLPPLPPAPLFLLPLSLTSALSLPRAEAGSGGVEAEPVCRPERALTAPRPLPARAVQPRTQQPPARRLYAWVLTRNTKASSKAREARAPQTASPTGACRHGQSPCLESLPIPLSELVRVHPGRPGGASDGYGLGRPGRGAAGPDRRVRLPRPGYSKSSFRTDSSLCPLPIGNGVACGPESVRDG